MAIVTTTNPTTSRPKTAKRRLPEWNFKHSPCRPVLGFSPTAWAKLLYMRDFGETEVGGFGISPTGDPLFVADVQVVKQTCTAFSVAFDDAAVAEFFDRQVDCGLRPEQFARIWVHTHPGHCPQPSATDEETFSRVFGRSDWALMFILAQGGRTYARLRFNVGPGGSVETSAEVDYNRPFAASDEGAWAEEYRANVHWPSALCAVEPTARLSERPFEPFATDERFDAWQEYVRGFDEPVRTIDRRLSHDD